MGYLGIQRGQSGTGLSRNPAPQFKAILPTSVSQLNCPPFFRAGFQPDPPPHRNVTHTLHFSRHPRVEPAPAGAQTPVNLSHTKPAPPGCLCCKPPSIADY